MHLSWLIVSAYLQLFTFSICSACEPPTEDNPVSVCAFCSDRHAGFRWKVHERNHELFFGGSTAAVDEVKVDFRCVYAEENDTVTVIDRDDCFDDLKNVLVTFKRDGLWRWNTLERHLRAGTECNFTLTLINDIYDTSRQMLTSCTVKECSEAPEVCSSVLPAPLVCPEPANDSILDSVCSCSCNDGFSAENDKLRCRNINECEQDPNLCGAAETCIDTEGNYTCALWEPSMTSLPEPTSTLHVATSGNEITPSKSPDQERRPVSATSRNYISSEFLSNLDMDTHDHTETFHLRPSQTMTNSSVASIHSYSSKEGIHSKTMMAAIPLSVTAAALILLSLLASIILLNRYFRRNTLKKAIFHAPDKFDSKYSPPIKIDRISSALRQSQTTESITTALNYLDTIREIPSCGLTTYQSTIKQGSISDVPLKETDTSGVYTLSDSSHTEDKSGGTLSSPADSHDSNSNFVFGADPVEHTILQLSEGEQSQSSPSQSEQCFNSTGDSAGWKSADSGYVAEERVHITSDPVAMLPPCDFSSGQQAWRNDINIHACVEDEDWMSLQSNLRQAEFPVQETGCDLSPCEGGTGGQVGSQFDLFWDDSDPLLQSNVAEFTNNSNRLCDNGYIEHSPSDQKTCQTMITHPCTSEISDGETLAHSATDYVKREVYGDAIALRMMVDDVDIYGVAGN